MTLESKSWSACAEFEAAGNLFLAGLQLVANEHHFSCSLRYKAHIELENSITLWMTCYNNTTTLWITCYNNTTTMWMTCYSNTQPCGWHATTTPQPCGWQTKTKKEFSGLFEVLVEGLFEGLFTDCLKDCFDVCLDLDCMDHCPKFFKNIMRLNKRMLLCFLGQSLLV